MELMGSSEAGTIGIEEQSELDDYLWLEHFLILVKASLFGLFREVFPHFALNGCRYEHLGTWRDVM